MKDDAIAVITARGGSKRIPRKNIKDFCGRPILKYSIDAALGSGCFEDVMVSTDDEEIAEVARRCGASVPFMRSAETANDYATTLDVLREVIGCYADRGRRFEYLCCLYPTAPFIRPGDIRDAMERLKSTPGADSLVPVVRFPVPVEWALRIQGDFLRTDRPEMQQIRSQDIPPAYYDPGQFYLFETATVADRPMIVGPKTIPYIYPEEAVQDIDTPDDWAAAELKYELLASRRRSATPR